MATKKRSLKAKYKETRKRVVELEDLLEKALAEIRAENPALAQTLEQKPQDPAAPKPWDHEYRAFAIIAKPNTGGLKVLRQLKIVDGKIAEQKDGIENLFGVCAGNLQNELELA